MNEICKLASACNALHWTGKLKDRSSLTAPQTAGSAAAALAPLAAAGSAADLPKLSHAGVHALPPCHIHKAVGF